MTWRLNEGSPYWDQWFACDNPERPYDENVIVHLCCWGCSVAVEAWKHTTCREFPHVCDGRDHSCSGYRAAVHVR